MLVYRLTRAKYGFELSGKGAAFSGGRWNSTGIEMIYTASSRALAMAEVAVHLSLATLPNDYFMLTIQIPDDLTMERLNPRTLPSNWINFPPNFETQHIGNEFIIHRKSCILQVPSAVVKGDFNYLINPFHDEFPEIKVIEKEPFPFDKRLLNSYFIRTKVAP